MVKKGRRIIALPFTFLVAGGRIRRGKTFDTRKEAEAFLRKTRRLAKKRRKE